MTRSIINILDNSCTTQSPCLTCVRQDMDKTKCCETCAKLAAYRNGQSWEELEMDNITKETPTAEPLRGREYHKTTITPASPIPQMRGLLTKEAGGKCLIEGCGSEHKLIRGLCNKHYQQWHKRHLKHPVLGDFSTWQAKSKVPKLKKEKEKPMADEAPKNYSKTEKPYPGPDLITLDFEDYQQLKQVITEEADKFALPVEHVIMSFIAGAVARITPKK